MELKEINWTTEIYVIEWVNITPFNEWHVGLQIEQYQYMSYEGIYGKTGSQASKVYLNLMHTLKILVIWIWVWVWNEDSIDIQTPKKKQYQSYNIAFIFIWINVLRSFAWSAAWT